MNEIKPDLHDELLRRQLTDTLAKCHDNAECLRQAAGMLIESLIQSRVAAKYLGREAAHNTGNIWGTQSPDQ